MTEPRASESPKSAYASKPHKVRRLSRTLKRPGITFRPIEGDDIKYAGAAWKLGAFKGLNPVFDREMSPAEFRETFVDIVQTIGSGWTVLADGPKGVRPIGFIFGLVVGNIIVLTRIIPMPWSTLRQRLQGFLAWLNVTRRQSLVFDCAAQSEKRFFEHLCRYGVMKRVGTVDDLTDEPAALFQSRKPK